MDSRLSPVLYHFQGQGPFGTDLFQTRPLLTFADLSNDTGQVAVYDLRQLHIYVNNTIIDIFLYIFYEVKIWFLGSILQINRYLEVVHHSSFTLLPGMT